MPTNGSGSPGVDLDEPQDIATPSPQYSRCASCDGTFIQRHRAHAHCPTCWAWSRAARHTAAAAKRLRGAGIIGMDHWRRLYGGQS